MKHFCIDIDNTVACSDKIMRRVISTYSSGRVQLKYDDIVTFNYYECLDRRGNHITEKEWKEIHVLWSERKNVMSIQPMPGAVDALRRLAKYGTIHLATSRLRVARAATAEWLDSHDFPDHELHFLKHGKKHSSLRSFAAAVEDYYEQAVDFAALGTPSFLIRHPWNQDREPVDGVQWVENWEELIEYLMDITHTRRRGKPNKKVPDANSKSRSDGRIMKRQAPQK